MQDKDRARQVALRALTEMKREFHRVAIANDPTEYDGHRLTDNVTSIIAQALREARAEALDGFGVLVSLNAGVRGDDAAAVLKMARARAAELRSQV